MPAISETRKSGPVPRLTAVLGGRCCGCCRALGVTVGSLKFGRLGASPTVGPWVLFWGGVLGGALESLGAVLVVVLFFFVEGPGGGLVLCWLLYLWVLF